MKITNVESFIVDAGWRPWVFVKVETDEGISGYGECSVSRGPFAVAGAVEDLKPLLLGTDPRAYEMRFWEMSRKAIAEPLGIRAKAIAGVELAILDIKARALGISVVELFGGPTRDKVRLYWSHCGTTRALYPEMGTPPIKTMGDISELGKEVVRRGYTALKTNIVFPGNPARVHFDGFGGGPGQAVSTDQVASTSMLKHIETLIGSFREAVGPEVDICLDLNFNFKPESCKRIAKILEPFNLLWLEIDMYSPEGLREIKDSTSTKICTGENQIYMQDYLPYFQARCADVFMVDVAWMGFSQAKKVGDLAQIFEFNVAPHNYYSHLSSFISASLCAVLPNIRIQEIDVDDVPLREELVTRLPEIQGGYMKVPAGPGWGTELREDVARKNPWRKPKARW
jgi:galactonate dehydratase